METEVSVIDTDLPVFGGLCEVTDTSLVFTSEPTLETWGKIGEMLGKFDRWTPWAIGDWLIFGDSYGEDASQYIEVTGVHPKTAANYAYVCSKVSHSRRRAELDFSHHEAVANLEPDDQTEFLDRAIGNSLTVSDLREMARAKRRGEPREPTAISADKLIRRLIQLVLKAREELTGMELGAFNAALEEVAFDSDSGIEAQEAAEAEEDIEFTIEDESS